VPAPNSNRGARLTWRVGGAPGRVGRWRYQRRSIDCCSAVFALSGGGGAPVGGFGGGGLGLSFMSVVLPGRAMLPPPRSRARRRCVTRGR